MNENPTISIFVPAHNEVQNITGSIEDITWAIEGLFRDYEVLIVDDGSTDGTGEVAKKLADEDSRIKVIHHPQRRGIGRDTSRPWLRPREITFRFFRAIAKSGLIPLGRFWRPSGRRTLLSHITKREAAGRCIAV